MEITTTPVTEHVQHFDNMWRVITFFNDRQPTSERFDGERTARELAARNARLETVKAVHLIVPGAA